MNILIRNFLRNRLKRQSHLSKVPSRHRSSGRWLTRPGRLLLLSSVGMGCVALLWLVQMPQGIAQSNDAVQQQEDALIKQQALPQAPARRPVVTPQPQPAPARRPQASPRPAPAAAPAAPPRPAAPAAPAATPSPQPAPQAETPAPSPTPAADSGNATASAVSQYVLQFNRSPVVGNALQLEGVMDQARLGFTRPRHWQMESAKMLIRFRHSPALYADRSNLTVRLNNVHLGSVPLNRSQDEVGNVMFDVPTNLIEDYNTIDISVQQHSSPECTDPTDPVLWTEILPDSQVVMNYRPQAIGLDFANYPYPFLDDLGLDADRLAYAKPKAISNLWLTAIARWQVTAARMTNARPLETRLVQAAADVKPGESLIVVGTPAEQPLLAELALPFTLKDNKVLDGSGQPLPDGVGVLMLTTTDNGSSPVLVATGNTPAAALKAVQALAQPGDRQLLTGQAVLVNEVANVPSPNHRDWPGYLPAGASRLQLLDLKTAQNQPVQDVTVNGLPIPPMVEFPLKLLPDEKIQRGSTFTLRYSYGPGIDPRRSSVSIFLNNQGIGGERLTATNGETNSITVDLPPDLMTSNSTLGVQFFTYPNTLLACGEFPDQPMWGTVHADSTLNLNRVNQVNLPDLKRLQTGFPLTAPQDLSNTAVVLPDQPTDQDVTTLLATASRLGRLSQADSVQLAVHTAGSLPDALREQANLIGIGLRNRFPLPEVFQNPDKFQLGELFSRSQGNSRLQTLPDTAGVVQSVISPWNSERVLLGLTGQTDQGLSEIQQLLKQDALFARMQGDTVLIHQENPEQALADPNAFEVTTLTQRSPQTIDHSGPFQRIIAFFQQNWFLLPLGLLVISLLSYGISQVYLNRLSRSGGQP